MSNIKKIYHPLNDAAKILNCTVSDIYHLGATRRIEICTYIPKVKLSPFNVLIKENGDFVYNEMEVKDFIGDRFFYMENFTLPSRNEYFTYFFDCKADTLGGFFALNAEDIINFELKLNDEYSVIEPDSLMTSFFSAYDFEMINIGGVKVKESSLVIMDEAIKDFDNTQDGVIAVGNDEKRKPNTTKQNKFIKSLIDLQYGKGASENIYSLINEERGTGDLLKDFQLSGIKPPVTAKTLKTWLDGVELDYVEIPTSRKEISKK